MIDTGFRRAFRGVALALAAMALAAMALSAMAQTLATELAGDTARAAPSAPGDAFSSPQSRAAASSARLLSGGPSNNGTYTAGVEIDLDPGTITYWRSPGEAGAPPVFDFSGSINVTTVDVVYPAPKRIEEQGVIVAGYDGRVIFPLKIQPRDPKAPVTLKVLLHYSACGKICLPARANLSMALPQTGVSPYAADIAESQSHAPLRLDPKQTEQFLAVEKSAPDRWRFSWRGHGKADAVFVEVADPLYIESVPHEGVFDLKLYPESAASAPVAATVTVVTDSGSYEAPVTLR